MEMVVYAISKMLGGGVHQVAVWGFKFDESTDTEEPRRFFSIGGLIATDSKWESLESDWEECIVRQNSECKEDQKITGYHGSTMNAVTDEFKNWDDSLSRSFTSKMLSTIGKSGGSWFSLCWDMDALREEFPGGELDKRKGAYFLGVMLATVSLGKIFHRSGQSGVFMFHHHEEWAALAISAFSKVKNEKRLPYGESLLSIAPIYNGNRAAEIADLCSYEAYREIKRRVLNPERKPRHAYTWLSQHGVDSGLIWIDKAMVRSLRELLDDRRS
jgi:hypothetical protein